jgi:hypothetical protein
MTHFVPLLKQFRISRILRLKRRIDCYSTDELEDHMNELCNDERVEKIFDFCLLERSHDRDAERADLEIHFHWHE